MDDARRLPAQVLAAMASAVAGEPRSRQLAGWGADPDLEPIPMSEDGAQTMTFEEALAEAQGEDDGGLP